MAASKVSDLTALAGEGAATGDLLLVTDVSATTAGSKNCPINALPCKVSRSQA